MRSAAIRRLYLSLCSSLLSLPGVEKLRKRGKKRRIWHVGGASLAPCHQVWRLGRTPSWALRRSVTLAAGIVPAVCRSGKSIHILCLRPSESHGCNITTSSKKKSWWRDRGSAVILQNKKMLKSTEADSYDLTVLDLFPIFVLFLSSTRVQFAAGGALLFTIWAELPPSFPPPLLSSPCCLNDDAEGSAQVSSPAAVHNKALKCHFALSGMDAALLWQTATTL